MSSDEIEFELTPSKVIWAIMAVTSLWLLGWLINLAYITYTPPGFTVEIPITIRLAAHNLTAPFLTAFISTVLSTLLPAVKAARTRIVDALRYV